MWAWLASPCAPSAVNGDWIGMMVAAFLMGISVGIFFEGSRK